MVFKLFGYNAFNLQFISFVICLLIFLLLLPYLLLLLFSMCVHCFPGDSEVKNLLAMQDTWVQSLGWEIPWRRKWQPTPIFSPGKSHRGAWWAIVHGVARVGYNLASKSPPYIFIHSIKWFILLRMKVTKRLKMYPSITPGLFKLRSSLLLKSNLCYLEATFHITHYNACLSTN